MHTFTWQQRDWIDALRSGEYQQAKGVLTTLDRGGNVTGHCCLGVGAERAILGGCPVKAVDVHPFGKMRTDRMYVPADENEADRSDTALLYGPIKAWLGLKTDNGCLPTTNRDGNTSSLASLNDSDPQFTFAQIADLVEHFAADLFVPTPATLVEAA